MKNPQSPQAWLFAGMVCLVGLFFFSVTGWLLAAPAEEIAKAVATTGKTDPKQASADSFLDALSSVLVTVKPEDSGPYLDAAVKMRPDLKDQIKAEADDVYTADTDTDETDRHRVSRHRHRVAICCQCPTSSCHTLYFPRAKARRFLHKHPQCHRGVCPDSTPAPTA